jgi:hypothetical protein
MTVPRRPVTFDALDASIAYVHLASGERAVVDIESVPLVASRNWYRKTHKKTRVTYAATWENGDDVRLHRLLWKAWGLPPSDEIDHRDHDGLNCRRANLRAATHAENLRNVAVKRTSTNGLKGVTFDRRAKLKQWRAQIKTGTKRLHLGRFVTKEEAARAYEQASYDFHGAFASA